MNGRIVKRLNFDTISTPVEQKRKFVLNHIERNPVDIRSIREYDNLIRTRNFAGFLNKASLDASKSQGRSLQEIAKNSEESKKYLQSLKDRIKNIKTEIQKRQQTLSSIGNISPIQPVQRSPQDSAPTTIAQMTKDELISEDPKGKIEYVRLNEILKRGTEELDDIDPLISQIVQMKLEGKPQEEIDEAKQTLEDKVNTSFDESVMEDVGIQATDEQVAQEMEEEAAREPDEGPSRRLLEEEDQPTAQAEPVKIEQPEEFVTPKTGEQYNAQQFEPLQLRGFVGQRVRYTTGEGEVISIDRSSRNNTVVRVKDDDGQMHNVKVFTIL